jgi:hypothetical protein
LEARLGHESSAIRVSRRSERTFERQFETECVAPPDDEFNIGTARGDEFQGPGDVNWDISVFKNVPVGSTRRLQFRIELYNAFDTDQWTGRQDQRELQLRDARPGQPNPVWIIDARHQQRPAACNSQFGSPS